MRITTGRGNASITVVVPQGKAFRQKNRHEKARFERDFCRLAGIKR